MNPHKLNDGTDERLLYIFCLLGSGSGDGNGVLDPLS